MSQPSGKPPSPAESLGLFDLSSEGPELEWKVRLPRKSRIGPLLCAFANGAGGSLIVGVADDGRVVGITRPGRVIEFLTEIAQEDLAPGVHPSFLVQPLNHDGRALVLCKIPLSDERPVYHLPQDGEPCVYLRDGSSTRKAQEFEIRLLEKLEGKARRPREGEAGILAVLAEEGRASSKRLAECLLAAEADLKRTLSRMLRDGLLFIGSDHRWSLTPEGARMVEV